MGGGGAGGGGGQCVGWGGRLGVVREIFLLQGIEIRNKIGAGAGAFGVGSK